MPSVASRATSELPDIDDRLVEAETRYEMFDGELVHVWVRIEALLRNRAFVAPYTTARERWREGIPVMFRRRGRPAWSSALAAKV